MQYQAPGTTIPQRSTPYPSVAPSLKPHEKQFFDSLFYKLENSMSGYVSGAAIKPLFTASQLPKTTLATIWSLADAQKQKALNIDSFYTACKLIAAAQANLPVSLQTLKTYPDLPLAIFHHESGSAAPPPSTSAAPLIMPSLPLTAPNTLPLSNLPLSPAPPPSHSMSAPMLQTPGVSSVASPASPALLSHEWAMSPHERAQYAALFTGADLDKDGFVSGKEANVFFKQSGLENSILKQIWLLSDVDRDNKLNLEEFMIAMHLTLRVRKKFPLPSKLPEVLDPRRNFVLPAEIDPKTQKPKLNMDLLPEIVEHNPLPTIQHNEYAQQSNSDLLQSSQSGSRRASVDPHAAALAHHAALGAPHMLAPVPSYNIYQNNPALNPTSSYAQSLIETVQSVDEKQNELVQVKKEIDSQKRQQGVLEDRLEAHSKNLSQLEAQVEQERKVLDAEKAKVEELNTKSSEIETRFHTARSSLTTLQQDIQATDAQRRAKEQELTQLKASVQDADMQIAVLESQLAALRSSLKGIEDLKEHQANILAARKEQQNRLLQEKAEITELLNASKNQLATMKNQAQIFKSTLQSHSDDVLELRAQLQEVKEIAEQEKSNPALASRPALPVLNQKSATADSTQAAYASPKQPNKHETPPTTAANTASTVRTQHADLFVADDDDDYNIDDIQLPTSILPASSAAPPQTNKVNTPSAKVALSQPAPPIPAPSPPVTAAAAVAPAATPSFDDPFADADSNPFGVPSASASLDDESDPFGAPAPPSPRQQNGAHSPSNASASDHSHSASPTPHSRSASPNSLSGPSPMPPQIPAFPSELLHNREAPAPPGPAPSIAHPAPPPPPPPAPVRQPSNIPTSSSTDFESAPASSAAPAESSTVDSSPFGDDDTSDPFGSSSSLAAPAAQVSSIWAVDDGAADDPFGSSSAAAPQLAEQDEPDDEQDEFDNPFGAETQEEEEERKRRKKEKKEAKKAKKEQKKEKKEKRKESSADDFPPANNNASSAPPPPAPVGFVVNDEDWASFES